MLHADYVQTAAGLYTVTNGQCHFFEQPRFDDMFAWAKYAQYMGKVVTNNRTCDKWLLKVHCTIQPYIILDA